ncbi:alpha mating-type protein MAT1-1-1 [Aspergillus lentulus]|uniref:Alpha mating-type protein MAT1-1-1 n=1 Tax=Aspergillus lentulus TaxID=293939 RepID=S5RL55_ASPLE|nr:alpha mating-type protein MAT1-1-1 [Aspergillus lentulus]GFF83436.1 alpha mating-type protein MAT1-1-1 [Aspergillus lentulus]
MEAAISPLERAFNTFLMTMPPEQLEELLQYLQDTKAQENNGLLLPNATPANAANYALDNHHGAAVPVAATPRPLVTRAKRTQEGKKRPLNSFIAFRSFYSVIFPDLTQKAKSGILRFLWQNDPFKAKWAILAKAYSIIRDDHGSEVSLDQFLEITAKFIGLFEPARYLDAMGWQLNFDDQQQYTMAKVKITTIPEADVSTNYSVDDIVKHCYDTGYVSEKPCKHTASNGNNTSAMAFAAQPAFVVKAENGIRITSDDAIVTDNAFATPEVDFPTPEETDGTQTPDPVEAVPVVNNHPLAFMDVPGVPGGQQLELEWFQGNEFNLNDMQLPFIDALPFDLAVADPFPLNYDPLEEPPFGVFDIDQYINV